MEDENKEEINDNKNEEVLSLKKTLKKIIFLTTITFIVIFAMITTFIDDKKYGNIVELYLSTFLVIDSIIDLIFNMVCRYVEPNLATIVGRLILVFLSLALLFFYFYCFSFNPIFLISNKNLLTISISINILNKINYKGVI
jgi:quinol-cytochrome oxidoreductase complex cytochrome b subunit